MDSHIETQVDSPTNSSLENSACRSQHTSSSITHTAPLSSGTHTESVLDPASVPDPNGTNCSRKRPVVGMKLCVGSVAVPSDAFPDGEGIMNVFAVDGTLSRLTTWLPASLGIRRLYELPHPILLHEIKEVLRSLQGKRTRHGRMLDVTKQPLQPIVEIKLRGHLFRCVDNTNKLLIENTETMLHGSSTVCVMT